MLVPPTPSLKKWTKQAVLPEVESRLLNVLILLHQESYFF